MLRNSGGFDAALTAAQARAHVAAGIADDEMACAVAKSIAMRPHPDDPRSEVAHSRVEPRWRGLEHAAADHDDRSVRLARARARRSPGPETIYWLLAAAPHGRWSSCGATNSCMAVKWHFFVPSLRWNSLLGALVRAWVTSAGFTPPDDLVARRLIF